ncbi:MAG: PEGA domain-containing protein, partial [Candidatus Marinimicrobia bacterium]|nr:PEGA domain-containing protein [Candidatus Neomarinimicrobiota bacterium]
MQANLNPRFGKLTITSDPPGCVIKLNDQTKGRTPYIVNQIESGTYKITVSKELYHTHNDNYIITDGSTNQRHIDLTPAFGNLRITSTPSGAEVKIDSEPRGLTPFVLDELPSGKYNLSLLLDLYQTIEKTILIEDGKTNDMDIRLEARFALLSVTGLPAGADIHANGELIGSIPLQKYRIPEGMVELKIAADKYHTHTEFLNIRRGQPVNQTVSLKRHTGKLIVITEPPGAEIFLDDRSVGESPKILDEIPIGNHSILVDHPDYLEDYKEFNLTLDEKEEFRFKLLTYQGSIDQQIDQIKSKRKKYLYVTIASAVLGAYMNYSANQSYDQYIKSNSSSSAKSNYNKTVLQDKLSSGGYGLALVGTIPLIKMSADIKNLEKQLTSNEANPTKTGDGIK